MPVDVFLEESKEFEEMMDKLEKALDKREKVINLIMAEGKRSRNQKGAQNAYDSSA